MERTKREIFVIGCGRWGSFIAWYLAKIGHNVSLYGRKTSKAFNAFFETRKNEYLTLPDSIRLTSDLDEAAKAEIIVISVGSQNLRSLCEDMNNHGIHDKKVVLCMKGIEIATGERLTQVVGETLDVSNKAAVWLGPGHVQEFTRGVPNCMVIDSEDDDLKRELIKDFSGPLIRFYVGSDLIGNEIGGAAKNVVGIAAGMLEASGYTTLKGALMARGTREIARLIAALGGNEYSAYGLCHLGDYEATLFSDHSQNLNFGRCIINKTEYKKLAEGYYTVKALVNISRKLGVELPICEAVYRILYEDADPNEALGSLFMRSLKEEF